MHRTVAALLATTVVAALAGCGGAGSSSQSHVSADAARASIERAAHVKLVAQAVPDDARRQGLRASYTNAATVAGDHQAVALFLLADPGVAAKVKDLVEGSAPKPSRLIVKDDVLVVYAAAGSDRGAQVEKAVNGL